MFKNDDDWPEGGGPDPDWGRYATGVKSRAQDQTGETHTKLGDPTRWGSQDRINVPLALGSFKSAQLIWVQTTDAYSRNWQIIGNISATQQLWDVSAANLQIFLEVTQGVGQGNVLQRFDLQALIALAAPWYVVEDGVSDTTVVTKPFVIAGGLIGRQISARVVVRESNLVILEDPQVVDVVAMLAPFAAGFDP